jgi:hypothetical protein
MKSIGSFLIGFLMGIIVLLLSLAVIDSYQEWKKARLDPVLVEMSGCGDQGPRQVWEGK